MKKLLVLIMTIAMCLVFAACANTTPAADDQEEDESHYAAEDMEVGSSLGSFTSVDLDGNEVTDAIFADKDVTVVNVWATFCDPCIGEMPDLQAMAEELPDNAQVIGVVIDALPKDHEEGDPYDIWEGTAYNVQVAEDIIEETGVKYTNILASESVAKMFEKVEAVPTTFIVDKSGKLVCKPLIGANVNGYRQAAEDYLSGL